VAGEAAALVSGGSAAWTGCDPTARDGGVAAGLPSGAAEGPAGAVGATAPPAAYPTGCGAGRRGLGVASASGAKTPHAAHAMRAAAPRCHTDPPAKNSEQTLDLKAELT
jgi:hypothetical protein